MSERHRLRSLWTLVELNGLIPIRTQPLYLVNLLASPLAFLFFITIASGGVLLAYGVGGGMILTMLSVGTGLQSDLTHYRHDLKFQDIVVASPVEAPTYVAGMALSELVYSTPGMLLFLGLWALTGAATALHAFILAGALLLVWAFASALAFTLATWFEDVRETFMFSPLISLGLTVIPPVYYPVSALPQWAQYAAYASPTTYAAGLVQSAMGLVPITWGVALLDWGVLLAFTAGLFLLAAFKARWREA
ncbi:MAG: ABC transporter permease [Thermoplasmata archaeon]|jgi:ABC-2 type transport system permease protein